MSFNILQKPTHREIIAGLESWYWNYGAKRSAGKSAGVRWLDEVTTLREHLTIHDESRNKPRLGIWGPSQSGKSTLISQGADLGATPDGSGSGLSWPGGEKVRFTGTSETPRSTVVFNPFNGKSDASGCVTRFIAADKVEDPARPVSVALLSSDQVMAAFAAGYADEVECVSWDAESVGKILVGLPANGINQHTESSVRELRQLIAILEQLAPMVSRFRLFAPSGEWRLRLLEHHALKGHSGNIRVLREQLLWDANPEVAKKISEIDEARKKLGVGEGANLQVSFSVAARLLDIDALRKSEALTEVNEWRLADRQITAGGSGVPIAEKFKYLQALIGELIVPVRRNQQDNGSAFGALLDRMDLVDFPGLPNTASDGKKRKEIGELADLDWWTLVFKRGKTLSLVANAARRLELDAFLILINGSQAAKTTRPGELRSAIQSWAHAADSTFPATLELAASQGAALPLKCVTAVTFFGEIVRDIHTNASREVSLGGLNHLDQIGALSNPRFVSLLPITYPSIPRGELPPPGTVRDEIQRRIRENSDFQKYFGSVESLAAYDAMFREADGGASHLFRFLAGLVSHDTRRHLTAKAYSQVETRLAKLVAEYHPVDDPEAEKRATLDAFVSQINARAASTTPREVGIALRDLLSVDYKRLSPLPANILGKSASAYIDEQINQWRDIAVAHSKCWAALGVSDTAMRARLVGYFSSSIPRAKIIDWMKENQVGVQDGFEQKAHRRFVATLITNGLIHGASQPAPHGSWACDNGEHVRQKIDSLVAVQNDESHNDALMREMWLAPWLATVERLQGASAPPPAAEPGDEEMREFKRRLGTNV